MSAASVLAGLAGVRRCIVFDEQRELLEQSGTEADSQRIAGAVADLSRELGAIAALLGVGTTRLVTTKGASAAWVVASEAGLWFAAEFDPSQPSARVEAALQDKTWSSLVERTVGDSDIEYVPEDDAARQWAGEGPTRPRLAVSESLPSGPPGESPRPSRAPMTRRSASGATWRKVTRQGPLILRSPMSADGQPARSEQPGVAAPPAARPAIGERPSSELRSASRLLAASRPFVGSLQTLCLAELLEFLRSAQRSGVLFCTSSTRIGTICLRSGRIVSATSPGTRPLSAYLVARGVVTAQEVRAKTDDTIWLTPLAASVAVKTGLAEVSAVRAALVEQVRDAIRELLTWGEGDFSFDSENTALLSGSYAELEIDPQGMLLEIFKDRDESARTAT